ncbi:MAG: hypothetical protein ACXVBU_11575, partial [Ktedonobacteraceae bacterium]
MGIISRACNEAQENQGLHYLDRQSWWSEQLARGKEQYQEAQECKQRHLEAIDGEVEQAILKTRKQTAAKRAKREAAETGDNQPISTNGTDNNASISTNFLIPAEKAYHNLYHTAYILVETEKEALAPPTVTLHHQRRIELVPPCHTGFSYCLPEIKKALAMHPGDEQHLM